METAVRVLGCYSWLVQKTFDLVAINYRSDALAASSISEAFHVIDIFHLTPLIDILDEFHNAILCDVPRLHKDVFRIF